MLRVPGIIFIFDPQFKLFLAHYTGNVRLFSYSHLSDACVCVCDSCLFISFPCVTKRQSRVTYDPYLHVLPGRRCLTGEVLRRWTAEISH